MRRVLAAFAALTIALPTIASAQGLIGALRDAQERQKNAQAPQAGPREGGRGNAPQPQAAPQPAPQAQDQARGQGRGQEGGQRGRGGPNAAQIAPQQPAPEPNVAQQRGRRGDGNPQLAPRQGGPAGNFAENRDRGREDDRNRDFRNNDRGRDFRNDDRGRDFGRNDRDFGRNERDFGRNDRDRGGRFFNFRGRQYTAIRGPAYNYPRGWGYRRWGRGEFLPSVFLAAPFYFDYDWLGLPPPPSGARWVRNGPDALLVSSYDGRILDVIYDAFY
jgi:Ni/Co efflux regulator RcnB